MEGSVGKSFIKNEAESVDRSVDERVGKHKRVRIRIAREKSLARQLRTERGQN